MGGRAFNVDDAGELDGIGCQHLRNERGDEREHSHHSGGDCDDAGDHGDNAGRHRHHCRGDGSCSSWHQRHQYDEHDDWRWIEVLHDTDRQVHRRRNGDDDCANERPDDDLHGRHHLHL